MRDEAVIGFEAQSNTLQGIATRNAYVALYGDDTTNLDDLILDNNGYGAIAGQLTFLYLRACTVGGNSYEAMKSGQGSWFWLRNAQEGSAGDNGGSPDLYAESHSFIQKYQASDFDIGSDGTSEHNTV